MATKSESGADTPGLRLMATKPKRGDVDAILYDTPNPFAIETQAENVHKWGKAKRSKRRNHLAKELAESLPALARYESKMRRAFNHWDKARARVARIERELATLDAHAMAEGDDE